MIPLTTSTRALLGVLAAVGALLLASVAPAAADPGQQQSFLAALANAERALATAEAKVDADSAGVVGLTTVLQAQSRALADRASRLSEADLAELLSSGEEVSSRTAGLTAGIANLTADPRLAQLLSGDQLARVTAALAVAVEQVQATTSNLNPSLTLWNTLGSAAEIGSSAVGGPGSLTIAGAEYVPGYAGGGVQVPSDRTTRTERLLFAQQLLTPEGTIELRFQQVGYDTYAGEPSDGRFHSFWSPDVRPYEGTYQGSLLTYQVPGEGWHFDLWDGQSYVRNTVRPDLAAGGWHHLAFAWSTDGSFTEVYLDGVLLNRVDHALAISATSPLPLQFGFDWDADNRGASSVLDELKIWSVARSTF